MRRTINIGGRAVAFDATVSTISRYYSQYGRDLFSDYEKAGSEFNNGKLSAESLITMLRLTHLMAKNADKTIPDDAEEWLDTFDVFPIKECIREISSLWIESMGGIVDQKKV